MNGVRQHQASMQAVVQALDGNCTDLYTTLDFADQSIDFTSV